MIQSNWKIQYTIIRPNVITHVHRIHSYICT